jgi:hypothetical protein
MVSSRVNPNFPPAFYELGEYDFQDMSCDVFSEEPGIATCNVYGTRGQKQHGIDLLAHCDDGIHIEVVQCKCYEKWLFLTYYAKLTIKMPSKQASIFVIIEIPKAIRRTFY